MGNTGGIGPEGPSIRPTETSGPGGVTGQPSGGSVENVLHAKVKTLGQLKQVLVQNLGEKEGTKLYNNFIQAFAMQMINQVQQSAAQAKKAAQQMGKGS